MQGGIPADFSMLQETIIIISGILVFISSQIVHELGHFAGYKILGYKPKFGFSKYGIPDRVIAYPSVTNRFTGLKLNIALLSGIIIGLIPIFIYFSVSKAFVLSVWLLAVYFYSCKSDFKSFIRNVVKE